MLCTSKNQLLLGASSREKALSQHPFPHRRNERISCIRVVNSLHDPLRMFLFASVRDLKE